MNRKIPTAEQAAIIESVLCAKAPATIGSAAQALGTTALEAAELFPEDIARFVSGSVSERFPEIWEALSRWEKVTLFIIHAGSVFEIEGKLSAGKIGGGYYNILSKDAVIGGHLNYQDLAAAAFLTMPFMGRESLSVQFFNKAGEAVFAVYAGRENHQIIPSVREAFFADRDALTAEQSQ